MSLSAVARCERKASPDGQLHSATPWLLTSEVTCIRTTSDDSAATLQGKGLGQRSVRLIPRALPPRTFSCWKRLG